MYAYHVSTNVSQYVILQETRMTRSGSHIPRVASSGGVALDAKSIGTRMTTMEGSHSAKKMGTR